RIACLCHHGARSQRVAAFLSQNGFGDVANVAGGIDAWSASRDAGVPRY
ncbi:sulfurtransferase, partial [Enterococcus sp. HPCN18]